MRPGSRGLSKLFWKGTLPLFKFDVNGIGLGSGKPIALHAPREEVEVDMRHKKCEGGEGGLYDDDGGGDDALLCCIVGIIIIPDTLW